MTSRLGSGISWYSYDLPNTIVQDTYSSQFFYTPDRARWKQLANYGATAETTIYLGGLMEKVTRGEVTEYKHYIPAGAGAMAIHTRRTNGTNTTYYVTGDHLGSATAVMDETGASLATLSFAALGSRRGAAWQDVPSSGDWTQITATTRHGFTGHEHLDNLSLIHMNGRAYDPKLGRFLSADPVYVGNLAGPQSLNPYSYVGNNPLSATDPSGFITEIFVGSCEHAICDADKISEASISLTTTLDLANVLRSADAFEKAIIGLWQKAAQTNPKKFEEIFGKDALTAVSTVIGISSADAAEVSRNIGLIGGLLRSQLDSGFEKDLFDAYWLAQGDLQLSQAEFEQIAGSLEGLPVLESYQIGTASGTYVAHKFDFYNNPRYDAGLGSAWVIFDSAGRAVGLYDRYDFNAKPWGVRSVSAEIQTRSVDVLGGLAGAAPYRITYGTYFELP